MNMNTTFKMPELLAPAGSYEKLVTAVHYGADAIYLGGRQFSLRARASNFDTRMMNQAVNYAHANNVKVYVTVNIFAHNNDLDGLPAYLEQLRDTGIDGIIVADPGVIRIAQEVTPELPIHLSTQANVTNFKSALFWQEQGVERINIARELGYDDICRIRSNTDVGLEVFVHGALCISYSGRCMLSSYMTGRDANKGDCAHPCRYSYKLVEEKRPGELFPVEEDERGTYIFNAKDLCLLQHLPKLVAAGIDSIKIEGRMKSMGYVGSAVRLYRTALNWIKENYFSCPAPDKLQLPAVFNNEMKKIGTRGYTENFFCNPPSSQDMLYDTMRVSQNYAPVGVIRKKDPLIIETRNVLLTGDTIEYLGTADIEPDIVTVTAMKNSEGIVVTRVNPNNEVMIETRPALVDPQVNSIVRKLSK